MPRMPTRSPRLAQNQSRCANRRILTVWTVSSCPAVSQGLYVTEFMGMGVNLVTGDYSRGASGLWISGGELTYPVEEITVAGNLKDMFLNISEVASDLEFRGAVAAPTLRIDGLTVGGE